jgi:hypothetical protein
METNGFSWFDAPRAGVLARTRSIMTPYARGERPCSSPFLNGVRFDAETRRLLSVALEIVCIALRVGDCDDGVKQAIATKLIDLAKTGERNPDILCERALMDIRRPPVPR